MFKSLLRTLPSLSGNFKLACKIDHIDKTYKINNINIYETSIRDCSLQPLQNKLFNRDINVNLFDGTYDYDVCKYYNKYTDKFYKNNYFFNKDDFKYWDPTINDETSVRNKDYEYGCKRISYNNTGFQFEFYAPIFVDNVNDLPKYFDIYIYLNDINTNMKILRVNIDNEYTLNYLYRYISKYLNKIDDKIICFNDIQATYFGLDVQNGGLTAIKDGEISYIYKEQLPINEFNRIINKGFERNKIIMRQIIPLAFQFNIDDLLLSESEKLTFYFSRSNIKGNYIDHNNIKTPIYDIECSSDELIVNGKNILFTGNFSHSLCEKQLNIYQYDNKINFSWNHWKLQLSSDDNPYYTNININYSNVGNKYGQFPNINNIVNINLDLDQNNIDTTKFHNNTLYNYNLSQNISTWYKLLNRKEYNKLYNSYVSKDDDFFDNKKYWVEVKNNYSYVNGILYDFRNLYYIKNIDNIDYFNIFLYPDINYINKYGSLTLSNYTIEYNDNNSNNTLSYDFSNHIMLNSDNKNAVLSKNNFFKKSSYNIKENKQFILSKNDKSVIYYDINDIFGEAINNTLFKNINSKYIISSYYNLNNIYGINNLKNIISQNNNIVNILYYKYLYDKGIYKYTENPISLNSNNQNIYFFIEKNFVNENHISYICELSNLYNINIDKNSVLNNLENAHKYKIVYDEIFEYLYYFVDYTSLDQEIYLDISNYPGHLEIDDQIEGYCRIENKEQFDFILNNTDLEIIPCKTSIDNELNLSDIIIKNITITKDNTNIIIDNDGFFNYKDENNDIVIKLYYKTKLIKLNNEYAQKITDEESPNIYFLYIKEVNENKLKNNTEYEYNNSNSENLLKFRPIYSSVYKYKEMIHQQNLVLNNYIVTKTIENNNIIYKSLNDDISDNIVYLENPQIQHNVSEEIPLVNIIDNLSNKLLEDINKYKKIKYGLIYVFFRLFSLMTNKYNDIEYSDNLTVNLNNIINTIFKEETIGDNNKIYSYVKEQINELLKVLNDYPEIFRINSNHYIMFEDVFDTKNAFNSDLYPEVSYFIEFIEEENTLYEINKSFILYDIITNLIYGNVIGNIKSFNYSQLNDDKFTVEFNGKTYETSIKELLFNIIITEFNTINIKIGIGNSNDDYLDYDFGKVYETSKNPKLDITKLPNYNFTTDQDTTEKININDLNLNITLLLKHIYDVNYKQFQEILKYYDLELYELSYNELDFINFDNDNSEYINIYTNKEGKKYAFFIYSPYIDNTVNTYNINDKLLFNNINDYELNSDNIKDIMSQYFNDLVPYLKTNFFSNYWYKINNKYNNIIVNLNKYLLNDRYFINGSNTRENYNLADTYNYSGNQSWQYKIYSLSTYTTPRTITLHRYMNFISPVFKKADIIKTYQLKYKKYKYNFGADNIYSTNVNINKYSPVYVFDNNEDKLYNLDIDSKNKLKNYEYEYKSFNDNSFYLLEPHFEIQLEKLLTYNELIEYENKENTLKIFKKYLQHYIKIDSYDENKILFLFNKYKVNYHSNGIKLNYLQNNKLYSLKYIFDIV